MPKRLSLLEKIEILKLLDDKVNHSRKSLPRLLYLLSDVLRSAKLPLQETTGNVQLKR